MSPPMNALMTRRISLIISIAIAFTAAGLVWFSTPWGVGTSFDSIQYLLGALALADGGSVFDLPAHWPPLYPVLLAVVDLFTDDIHAAARLFHTFVFAANVWLFSLLVTDGAQRGGVHVLLGTSVFALAPAVYDIHFMAWSEPPFIGLLLAHLWCMRRYFRSGSGSGRWLLVGGLIVGIAILTRYAGVAMLGATSLFLLLERGPDIRERLADLVRFVVPAAALPAIWFAGSSLFSQDSSVRELEVHWVTTEHLKAFASVLLDWFQAQAVGTLAATALLVTGVACIMVAVVRGAASEDARLLRLTLLLALTYVAFIAVSISLFDFYIPVDSRIFAPLLVCLLVAITVSAAVALPRATILAPVASTVLLVTLLAGLPSLSSAVARNTIQGFGYFGAMVQTMPILGFLRDASLPTVYSNAPELLRIHFGWKAAAIPALYDPSTRLPEPEYSARMDRMMEEFAAGRAAIVYFEAFSWRAYLPGRDVFEGNLALPSVYRADDGVVYLAP
ncbi:MAG: hypothetical protein CALGDGBN_00942 [Pseudomonadales bacterium]|nr:hypothetical protein [Pseudomonadales bacterium]